MTYIIEKRLADLQPYRPNAGSFAVRLDANESFIPLPDAIKQRFAEIINEIDYRRYPDPYANDLCKAFAGVYNIQSQDVTVGNGSDELIGLIMEAFLTDGAKALVFAPDFQCTVSMHRYEEQPPLRTRKGTAYISTWTK